MNPDPIMTRQSYERRGERRTVVSVNAYLVTYHKDNERWNRTISTDAFRRWLTGTTDTPTPIIDDV
jgi:hypothetical protein